jgi:hypothetical protein
MKTEEDLINEVNVLESIIDSQRKIMNVNNEIIAIKNRMIELSEQETSIYKRNAAMLGIACVIGFFIIIGLCITIVATS